jgi:DivIVA domain-containing protein
MALTPEDVVNKRFQSTKFREGYDQDEVDDFLDEIVVELRRLNQENDELRQRLVAADARIAELQRGGAAAAAPAEAAPAFAAAPAPVIPAPEPVAAPAAAEPSADTNNLLQLARRLHEEHVREGLAKKDALIAEGQAEAARIVAEAANAQQGQLAALEQERVALQHRVDELRTFEREYRQQLRTYIQGQLAELEGSAQPAAPAPAPAYGSAPFGSAPTGSASVGSTPVAEPVVEASPAYPGSAPSYPAAPAQAYPAPQTPPPGQFPGYGS